jgi:hypothetical protein
MGLLLSSLVGVLAAPIDLPGAMPIAVAGLAAVAALLLAIASQAVRPLQLAWSGLRATARQRSEQTVFLRLRDPDAAGRPRPRAPSDQPTAG